MCTLSCTDFLKIILQNSSHLLSCTVRCNSVDILDSSLISCSSLAGFSFFGAERAFFQPPSLVKHSKFGCSRCEQLLVHQSLLHGCSMQIHLKNSLSGTEHPLEEQSCQSKDLKGQELRTEHVDSDLSLSGRKGKRRYVSFQHY